MEKAPFITTSFSDLHVHDFNTLPYAWSLSVEANEPQQITIHHHRNQVQLLILNDTSTVLGSLSSKDMFFDEHMKSRAYYLLFALLLCVLFYTWPWPCYFSGFVCAGQPYIYKKVLNKAAWLVNTVSE